MKKEDDNTKVTITFRGRSVTTTAGRLHKLANSPRLLKKIAEEAKEKVDK